MGTLNLNDMGFPEVKELITVELNEMGDVVTSSKGGVASIWYVAPISLPKVKIEIGETWPYEKVWMNPYLNVPLRLNIVSTLKGIYRNKKGERLADIGVSGNIAMSIKKNKTIMYKNEILGDYLFNISTGNIENS